MFEEVFGDDPQAAPALLAQLGDEEQLTPEQREALKALKAQAARPPSSRQVLDTVDPMRGPTRGRAPAGTLDDRVRSAHAQQQIDQGGTAAPLRAKTFGASAPFPAAVSGFASSLMDEARDRPVQGALDALLRAPGAIKNALGEANARGAMAPYQEDVPTLSGEFKQRGYDPGAIPGFLLDAVTDPSNVIGGEADDVAKGAAKGVGAAAAAWFPKNLKDKLDTIASGMKQKQKATWVASGKDPKKFGPHEAEIETAIKNVIRNDISQGDPRQAEKLIDAYETIELPTNFRGVNFDERRPVQELLTHDEAASGVKFGPESQQRLQVAYEQGSQRAEKEQWGDSRWLYHLTNGDPKMAVQITRLLGAFSPGQKTDANTLNAIEAFLRSARGESVDDILGHKVPDPARPGKEMRQGATLSTGHPRPSTVEDNLQRAMQLGRIFAAKVEALAGAELGLHDDIPIDMWLMRAIGAQSDVTPAPGAYRLISEAMAKEAALKNENPFEYMAKVWMGMQDIVGTPTPSFGESASLMRLPDNLAAPGVGEQILGNMPYHSAGIKGDVTGARSVIANQPALSHPDWLQQAQDLFTQGKSRDVLGKKKIVQDPKRITLDELLADTQDSERREAMMRGAQRPGSVIANIGLEAAPGAKTGVSPGYGALPQAEKEKRDRSLLKTLLNKDRKVGVAEALFKGRTASPIEGQGYWPTPQGVERNILNTIPVEMQTAPGGEKLDPAETNRAMALLQYLGLTYGQNAVPATAVQFGPTRAKRNVLRAWPSAGEKFPRAGQALGAALPQGQDWVISHRDTGVDLFKPSGKALTRAEQGTLEQAATGVMTPEGRVGAGTRAGTNIAGKAGYVEPSWGAEGSRQATTGFIKAWSKLSPTEKADLDAEAMAHTAQMYRRLKKDPGTSPAQLNALKIIASEGITGLRKALKDPNQLLPVLASLGLAGSLGAASSDARPSASPGGT